MFDIILFCTESLCLAMEFLRNNLCCPLAKIFPHGETLGLDQPLNFNRS